MMYENKINIVNKIFRLWSISISSIIHSISSISYHSKLTDSITLVSGHGTIIDL